MPGTLPIGVMGGLSVFKTAVGRAKYEVMRRLLPHRPIEHYRYTHVTAGGVDRVTLRNAAGRTRELSLRSGTSDLPLLVMTFWQRQYDTSSFARHGDIRREYEAILARGHTPLIVDAGANIGLASLYFRDQFPKARIVAIEPEAGNFRMLDTMLADDELATARQAALANFDGAVSVTDPGLGVVGFRTEKAEQGVPALTLRSIVADAQNRDPSVEPFLLKIDIEGFEQDLFDDPVLFDRFYVSFIELHDWMLPRRGSSASFLKMVSALDRDFILHGENVVSIRNR